MISQALSSSDSLILYTATYTPLDNIIAFNAELSCRVTLKLNDSKLLWSHPECRIDILYYVIKMGEVAGWQSPFAPAAVYDVAATQAGVYLKPCVHSISIMRALLVT